MDIDRFDNLAQSVGATASRRQALRTLAMAAVSSVAVRLGVWPEPVDAEEDDVDEGEIAPENLFGCKNVGDSCSDNSDCCSNICKLQKKKKKKKGKKKKNKKGVCDDHNSGLCSGENACAGNDRQCGEQGLQGACYVTTGNAAFCGRVAPNRPPALTCANCLRDSDCVNAGYPAGSACVVCSNICLFSGVSPNGTACVGPAAN
jgi:hypothetical protein